MELYLQFGYGMMEHCRHLLSAWGGGTAVLSPRDLTPDQITRLGCDIDSMSNGKVLIDPQFYLPHSDHERLCSHEYWPDAYSTGAFWQGTELTTLLTRLLALNTDACSSAFVLPGLLATAVDDDWLTTQQAVLQEAVNLNQELPLISTIAVAADAVRQQDQVENLLESSTDWPVDGVYVVCEHPNGDYLADDPNWVANVLDLAAGFRLRGIQVILGYCNHQLLIAAAAKVHAVCSGTWMNVRSFSPDKFRLAYDEEIRQRATWYYAPQALTEYKVPFLDIAHRQGLLEMLAPPPELDGGYAAVLFAGGQPSTVTFTEQTAFRHYLHCLHGQVANAEKVSFEATIAHLEDILDAAERLLSTLGAAGVRGQQRDFTDCVDVNRAALSVLNSTRGPILRRRWAAL